MKEDVKFLYLIHSEEKGYILNFVWNHFESFSIELEQCLHKQL